MRDLKKQEPIPKDQTLSISIRKFSESGCKAKVDGEFSYDEIKLGYLDTTAVAIFNSKSFKRVTQYSRSFAHRRAFEIIEPKLSNL